MSLVCAIVPVVDGLIISLSTGVGPSLQNNPVLGHGNDLRFSFSFGSVAVLVLA